MKTAILEARNISLNYKNNFILNSIDIDVYAGEVTTLLGPNGAGKSTLLNMFTHSHKHSGKVRFFNKEATSDFKEFSKNIAFLPQNNYIDFPFLGHEIVEMGAIPLSLSSKEIFQLALHYMEQVEIQHRAQSLFTTLSGGEQQRIHIARVLLQLHQSNRNSLLILDEPISALDLKFQHHVLKLLYEKAHQENFAILQILHDLNLAAQYSDRMVFLNKGVIEADGTPQEIFKTELIKSVYGMESIIYHHPTQKFLQMMPA